MPKKSAKACSRGKEGPYAEVIAEVQRCRAGIMRSFQKKSESLVEYMDWSLEQVATQEDVESLREDIRQLRRPR